MELSKRTSFLCEVRPSGLASQPCSVSQLSPPLTVAVPSPSLSTIRFEWFAPLASPDQQDIISTFTFLGLLRYVSGQYVIFAPIELVKELAKKFPVKVRDRGRRRCTCMHTRVDGHIHNFPTNLSHTLSLTRTHAHTRSPRR